MIVPTLNVSETYNEQTVPQAQNSRLSSPFFTHFLKEINVILVWEKQIAKLLIFFILFGSSNFVKKSFALIKLHF